MTYDQKSNYLVKKLFSTHFERASQTVLYNNAENQYPSQVGLLARFLLTEPVEIDNYVVYTKVHFNLKSKMS